VISLSNAYTDCGSVRRPWGRGDLERIGMPELEQFIRVQAIRDETTKEADHDLDLGALATVGELKQDE